MADNRRRLTLEEVHATIERRSVPEPNSGCRLWEGMVNQDNRGNVRSLYGAIRLRGRMVKVHRVAWEFANGQIPGGAHVLHRCDVPICCNPQHLFLGDNGINIADKITKERGSKKQTAEKAKEIHAMRRAGASHAELATTFGVNQSTISRILSGKRRTTALPATQE
jgi:hypothetical protein